MPESRRGEVKRRRTRSNEIADVGDPPHLLDPGPGDQNVSRSAFLQQSLGGLHARLGVKAPAHDALTQHVRERHSDVPGDAPCRAHDGHALVLRHSRGGVIERLVKAMTTTRAGLGETYEVLRRRHRVDSSPPGPSR